jgi:hypothetical protein
LRHDRADEGEIVALERDPGLDPGALERVVHELPRRGSALEGDQGLAGQLLDGHRLARRVTVRERVALRHCHSELLLR